MWAGGGGVVKIRWVFSCSLIVCMCVCVVCVWVWVWSFQLCNLVLCSCYGKVVIVSLNTSISCLPCLLPCHSDKSERCKTNVAPRWCALNILCVKYLYECSASLWHLKT